MTDTQDDPDALVPAAFAKSEFEAQTKAALLHGLGIEAVVHAGERSWIGAAQNTLSGGEVPVLVRRADVDRARAALEQTIEDSVDIDWSEVDVGDPDPEATREKWRGRTWFLAAVILIIAVLIALKVFFGPGNLIP